MPAVGELVAGSALIGQLFNSGDSGRWQPDRFQSAAAIWQARSAIASRGNIRSRLVRRIEYDYAQIRAQRAQVAPGLVARWRALMTRLCAGISASRYIKVAADLLLVGAEASSLRISGTV